MKNKWLNHFFFSSCKEKIEEGLAHCWSGIYDKGKVGVLAYILGQFINFKLDIQR